jgi:hypothetical protein
MLIEPDSTLHGNSLLPTDIINWNKVGWTDMPDHGEANAGHAG